MALMHDNAIEVTLLDKQRGALSPFLVDDSAKLHMDVTALPWMVHFTFQQKECVVDPLICQSEVEKMFGS